MKKTIFLLALVFGFSIATAQNKEKVKGSKNVIKQIHAIDAVHSIEVEDDLTVTMIKGGNFSFEVEADDNLHEFIKIETLNDKIRLYTTKKCTNYKKLNITFTYNDVLNSVTARHESIINAFAELEIEKLQLSTYDYAEVNLNVRSKEFNYFASDKSESKLNVTSPICNIQGKDNAKIEALINSENSTLSINDKSDAQIEGTIGKASINISGKGKLVGKNVICSSVTATVTSDSDCSVYASEVFELTANGSAKVELYGDPKITIHEFKDRVSLLKKDK